MLGSSSRSSSRSTPERATSAIGCCGSKGSRGEREPLLQEQRKAPEKIERKPCIQEKEAPEKIERRAPTPPLALNKLETALERDGGERAPISRLDASRRGKMAKVERNGTGAENAKRLDKLPPEVWEKILDHLDENDLFPLALSCRYFRQKQKKAGQSGKPHRALKTVIRRKLGERQPASADYIRFCIKMKGKRSRDSDLVFWNRDFRQLAAFHGHLPLLQELLKSLNTLDRDFVKYAGESSSSSSSLVWLLTSFSLLHSARRPSGDLAVAAPAGC